MKPTPVPELSSRLPKTMACTLTAVPRSWGMRSRLRYVTARGPFQEPNTASMAPLSCSIGSCGNGAPVARSTICLNEVTR